MAFRERIELLVDVTTGQATPALRRLRTDLENADGAFAKTRVASAALWDNLKAHAGTAALAAGAALVGFATKAVADFQEVALGAGKLRDSLGLTAEEASRLQEVGADLGISTEALESTINRMNRTADQSPAKFDAIGAAVKRNADGTVNVNETFLATVDALNKIPDASQRAAAAQEIFGRSWQDISELVATGADGVREALEGVEDAKVIDDNEIAKARKFRDTMDELRGVVESASLAIGEAIVPVLTSVADAAKTATDAVNKLQDVLPQDAQDAGFDIFSTGGDIIEDFKHNWEVLDDTIRGSEIEARVADTAESVEGLDAEVTQATGSMSGMDRILDSTTDTIDDAADATADLRDRAAELDRRWDALKDTVSDDQAWIDVRDSFADVQSAATESWGAAAAGAADASQKARDHASSVNAAKDRVIDYGREVLHLPPERLTSILALIDNGRLAEAEERLDFLTRTRTVRVNVQTAGGVNAQRGIPFASHSGTPAFQGGGVATVGEHGPELAFLPTGTKVVSQSETKAMLDGAGSGGNTVNVTINMPPGSNGNDVVRAIKRYERFNGPGWRAG